MSRRVGPSEQGQLQGANTALMALTGLWGPTIYTTTFAAFIGRFAGWHQPGAPFLLSALLLAAALTLAIRVTKGAKTDTSGH
jgi:DHA1 family tetracycline resistance protein-like MFS transporter